MRNRQPGRHGPEPSRNRSVPVDGRTQLRSALLSFATSRPRRGTRHVGIVVMDVATRSARPAQTSSVGRARRPGTAPWPIPWRCLSQVASLTSEGPTDFPGEVSYGVARAALENLPMPASRELAELGVTAHIVHPPKPGVGWANDAVTMTYASDYHHIANGGCREDHRTAVRGDGVLRRRKCDSSPPRRGLHVVVQRTHAV